MLRACVVIGFLVVESSRVESSALAGPQLWTMKVPASWSDVTDLPATKQQLASMERAPGSTVKMSLFTTDGSSLVVLDITQPAGSMSLHELEQFEVDQRAGTLPRRRPTCASERRPIWWQLSTSAIRG